jgi:septation ring formation regulator EzrA
MTSGNSGVSIRAALSEAIDDVAASVDGFKTDFDRIEEHILNLIRLAEDQAEQIRELKTDLENIEGRLIQVEEQECRADTSYLENRLEEIAATIPDIQEVIDNQQRAERQAQRDDLKAYRVMKDMARLIG